MESRNTIQRTLVYNAVHFLGHPTAEDVYGHIVKDHPTVSKGTVYRNLNLLVEKKQLRRVAVPGGADHFDFTLPDHYHIHCRSCGRVEDVPLPFQENLLKINLDTCGFLIEEHDIVFKGLCPQCLQEQV